MTITPGTPDDWTDTEEPERAEAFIEYLSINIGYNLRHYASPHASHQMGEGCQCRPSRIPHITLAAPESARPATLTPEQPVKAPGQDGDIFLTRRTPVEVEWPRSGNRVLRYVDEGGYQYIAGEVGNGMPCPWEDARIVRVLTEDKPTDADTEGAVYLSGPMTGLPDFNRPAFHAAAAALREQGHVVINPAEVDLGPDATWSDYMRIHLAEIARRVTQVFVLPGWESSRGAQLEVHVARSLGLPVVPAPAPVDPDDELVERMAKEVHDRNCADDGCRDWDGHGEYTRKAWREDARVVIRNLRAQGYDVTARADR